MNDKKDYCDACGKELLDHDCLFAVVLGRYKALGKMVECYPGIIVRNGVVHEIPQGAILPHQVFHAECYENKRQMGAFNIQGDGIPSDCIKGAVLQRSGDGK